MNQKMRQKSKAEKAITPQAARITCQAFVPTLSTISKEERMGISGVGEGGETSPEAEGGEQARYSKDIVV
jgi:hypothetical protein